jgi:hypothetical protein
MATNSTCLTAFVNCASSRESPDFAQHPIQQLRGWTDERLSEIRFFARPFIARTFPFVNGGDASPSGIRPFTKRSQSRRKLRSIVDDREGDAMAADRESRTNR